MRKEKEKRTRPGHCRKVLVVDDEEWMRDSCVQILEKEGLEVITAASGQAGVELARSMSPDVVLADLKMPGIDGISFLESVKAMDPDISAIVITGYATIDVAVAAMKAGACDFIAKPFNPSQLRKAVRRGIEHRQAAVRTSTLVEDRGPPAELHLAMLAHRFKEPLVVVRTCLGVVLHGCVGEIPSGVRGMIEVSAKRTDQMIHFVDEWLTLARLEHEQGIREPKTVSIRDIVTAAVDRARQHSQASKLSIQSVLRCDPGTVLGDPVALDELVSNLIDNAVRYTPAGGTVTVETDTEGGKAVVTVRDTGPGVPPEEADRIFEPFYRGKAQKCIPGTGLGLPIAKRIAEGHGGKIELQTSLGRGSAFRIVLPRAPLDAFAQGELAGRDQIHGERRTDASNWNSAAGPSQENAAH